MTLTRAVRGKRRGTSLIQVGSRAHSRDVVLGACLDWKIPNIPPLNPKIIQSYYFNFGRSSGLWEGSWRVINYTNFWRLAKAVEGFGFYQRLSGSQICSACQSISGIESQVSRAVICLVAHHWVPYLSPWSLFPILLPEFPGIQYHINYLFLNLCLRPISGGIQSWIWGKRL